MAIQIISTPSKTIPNVISDCFIWSVVDNSGTFLVLSGTRANISIEFPGSPVAPADGTEFTIWGYVFTFDSTSNYTANSFKVVAGNLAATLANMKSMFESNFFFRQSTSVAILGGTTVRIDWNDCREQERFAGDNMDVVELENVGCTVTVSNGGSPVYAEGFKIVARLLIDDGTTTLKPVTEFEGFEQNVSCNSVSPTNIDFIFDVRKILYSPAFGIDLLRLTYFDNSIKGMYRKFAIEVGYVYRENCLPKSGTFIIDGVCPVLNAFFPDEDDYGIRAYFPGAGGLPPGVSNFKFLTSQPNPHEVMIDSYCWLWFFTNKTAQGADADDTWRVQIDYTLTNGTTGTYNGILADEAAGTFDENDGYATFDFALHCINASPEFVTTKAAIIPANLAEYRIKIMGLFDGVPTQITEELTYKISGRSVGTDSSCFVSGGANGAGATDLYFVMPQSGIGTLPVAIEEIEIAQEGVEILTDVTCATGAIGREQRASRGGRSLTAVRSFDRVTYRAIRKDTPADRKFFEDCKRSPQHWVRFELTYDGGLNHIAKKLIVEPGGIKSYKNGEKIELQLTGYLQDVPIQNFVEPV